MIIYANGSGIQPLTPPLGQVYFPRWSRDGKWIAFTIKTQDTGYDIALIHVETKKVIRLTDWPGNEQAECFLYP